MSRNLRAANQTRGVGPVDHTDGKAFASDKMQGDIAAIVHVGATQPRGSCHCGQNFLGNRTGNRGHRRDEARGA